jgi:hypothetical protein
MKDNIVSVRFGNRLLDRVRAMAKHDDKALAEEIRDIVEREADRRLLRTNT